MMTVLESLVAKDYKLLQPIPLHVQNEGGSCYVSDGVFFRWGSGNTLQEAKKDYENDLLDYYDYLSENRDRLTRIAAQQMNTLEQYLDKHSR